MGTLRENYIELLVKLASRKRSTAYRLVALAVGGLVYLAAVPWILFGLGDFVAGWIQLILPPFLEKVLGVTALSLGLFWLLWSVWSQFTLGEGTPNPTAPPRRLIVKGAYRFCRNPIQLGIMLYYLGLGALLRDTTVGLTAFVVATVLGLLYHRYVEEEELKRRFGEEYEAYRKRTPFLIPRL